ncbi:MAG: iron-containing alcohol dehydrogenase [Proteobacteria bacterium]|nr:iron-containing alcohol dehydrogenase [Pseudomonadota bacterium]
MNKAFSEIEKTSIFFSPNKVILGKGAAQQAGSEVKALGGKKVLIVTDPGVVRAGLVQVILDALKSQGIKYEVFDKVEPEPPARVVDAGAQAAIDNKCDTIVGFGGGSSLDVAKGVSIVATNKGKVLDYTGIDMVPKRGIPKILIPTTAGTGSEVTRVFVVTDETDNTKKVIYTNYNLAEVGLLDPMLTLSMPPSVTADTGFDALVHAVESYVSVNTTPFAEVLALQAISLIAHNLPIAYSKGTNVQARYNMLFAASIAGMAFTSGGLGAVHGLSYPLGTDFHMAHGKSNAIMLPHIVNFNFMGNMEKYARIAETMGENIQGLSPYEAAKKSVDAIKGLLNIVNISYKLRDYGVKKSDLSKLVEGGLKQARLFIPNPRDPSEKDVRQIYEAAL